MSPRLSKGEPWTQGPVWARPLAAERVRVASRFTSRFTSTQRVGNAPDRLGGGEENRRAPDLRRELERELTQDRRLTRARELE